MKYDILQVGMRLIVSRKCDMLVKFERDKEKKKGSRKAPKIIIILYPYLQCHLRTIPLVTVTGSLLMTSLEFSIFEKQSVNPEKNAFLSN